MIKVDGENIEMQGTAEDIFRDLMKITIALRMQMVETFGKAMTDNLILKIVNEGLEIEERKEYVAD